MVRFDTSQYFMSASGKFAYTGDISPVQFCWLLYIFSIKFHESLPRILPMKRFNIVAE